VKTTSGSVAQIIIPSSSWSHTVFQTIENQGQNESDIITWFYYFSVGSWNYLAASTHGSGTYIYGYSWDTNTFLPIEHIVSPKRASDFTSYTISGTTYLW
jgi:hypothetical protein